MRSLVVRFAMLALVLGTLLSVGSSVSAQSTGTLTVHARYCDPGVVPDDPFTQCHDNLLVGFAVDFDGAHNAATTGDDGNATFPDLSAGQHLIQVHAPLKATSPIIFCSVVGGDGSALTLTSGDTDAGIGVPVGAGESVICDWYWKTSDRPSAGTPILTVHAMTCPSDNVPTDFWTTCNATPANNIEFFAGPTSIGSTDSNGMLVYDLGSTGAIDLNGGVPGEFARNFIYCSNDADKSVMVDLTEVVAGTSQNVAVGPDGTTCDWYIVPENLSGQTPTAGPVATSTPGAVTQLPNTGAGDQGGTPHYGLLALFALIALVIGAVGFRSVSSSRK